MTKSASFLTIFCLSLLNSAQADDAVSHPHGGFEHGPSDPSADGSTVGNSDDSVEHAIGAGGTPLLQRAIGAAHEPGSSAHHGGMGAGVDTSALPPGAPGTDGARVRPVTNEGSPGWTDGVGAFRVVCDYSHMNFDDAIVYPGQPNKAHLHTYFGNTSADASLTADNIRLRGNSTCGGGVLNRSAYWVPTLLTADGTPLEPFRIITYYKSGYRGVAPSQIQAMPRDLRMIAGDAKADGPQERVGWNCAESYVPAGHPAMLEGKCGADTDFVMHVEFPQCWDGRNFDSPDHKSHMAYAEGGCPASHPIALPAIEYKVYYHRPPSGMQGLRLASDAYLDPSRPEAFRSGAPGGYSVHADYMNGWDEETNRQFTESCLRRGLDCRAHLLGNGETLY